MLALPAPQILPILKPLASLGTLQPLLAALKTVTYAPMITVMAQYDTPTQQPQDPLPCPPTDAWMVEGHPATPLFWVGLDSSKRSAATTNVVIHSSAAFAQNWLDTPNLSPVGEALLTHASKRVASWLATPSYWQVHRWRYALVATAAAEPLLTMTDPLPLVACGDWCGKDNLDTALDSGWTAAATIHDALGGRALPEFPAGLMT